MLSKLTSLSRLVSQRLPAPLSTHKLFYSPLNTFADIRKEKKPIIPANIDHELDLSNDDPAFINLETSSKQKKNTSSEGRIIPDVDIDTAWDRSPIEPEILLQKQEQTAQPQQTKTTDQPSAHEIKNKEWRNEQKTAQQQQKQQPAQPQKAKTAEPQQTKTAEPQQTKTAEQPSTHEMKNQDWRNEMKTAQQQTEQPQQTKTAVPQQTKTAEPQQTKATDQPSAHEIKNQERRNEQKTNSQNLRSEKNPNAQNAKRRL